MLKKRYQEIIEEIIKKHIPGEVKVFIFGSSAKEEKFNDIDLGLQGAAVNDEIIYKIKDDLEESNIPYKVDVINFNQVDQRFSEKVFSEKILWLT